MRPAAVAYPFFLTKLIARSRLAHWLPLAQRLTDGGASFLYYFSDRVLAAPHRELCEAATFLGTPGPDTIDLAQGSPRFDLTPSGGSKLPAGLRGWPPPWGLPELRAAIAARRRADPDSEVLVTPGAAGALAAVLDAYVNPGDRVVLFDPTSPLYPLLLRQRRAAIHWVPTWPDQGRVRFRPEALPQAFRGARLAIIASPGNPTGGIMAPADLERIAWWAHRRDVLLFNDEVFGRYRYEERAESLAVQAKARQRTLTADSVSKGHALASARVGWLTGHRHLVRACALAAVSQAALVPTLCQQVALSALETPEEAFAPIRAEFDARRRYVVERLGAMGLQPTWPAGAFFVWLPVHGLGVSGRDFADRLLRGKRVLLWPGEFFGPSGSGHVRLSFAGDDGRLREGLGRLAELVAELRAGPGGARRQRAA